MAVEASRVAVNKVRVVPADRSSKAVVDHSRTDPSKIRGLNNREDNREERHAAPKRRVADNVGHSKTGPSNREEDSIANQDHHANRVNHAGLSNKGHPRDLPRETAPNQNKRFK